MVFSHLVNDGLAQYLPGILPLIAVERHIPLFLLGSLMTAVLIGQMLQPLAGLLADAMGGRLLMLGGPALSALGTLGVSFGTSYPVIVLSLLLSGIGSTLFHPQALASARRMAGPRQGLSMSTFLIGGELGRAIGPLAAGLVAASLGLSHMWILAGAVVLSWPWLIRVVPRLPKRTSDRTPLSLRRHLRPAAALLTFTAFRATALAVVVTFVPLLWQRSGGSLILGASLVTTLFGVGIVGNVMGGVLRDRFGSAVVLWGSAGVTVVMLIALAFAQGLMLWPIIGILGMGLFSTAPVTMLIGQDIFAENPALGSGIALGLGHGIGAILLLGISYAAEHMSLHSVIALTAIFPLLSMIGIRLLTRTGSHSRPAAAHGVPV